MISTNLYYEETRKRMVQTQLISRDIVDKEVIRAMKFVPRHRFLPVKLWDIAYEDAPVPIEEGQTISQPYIVAYMIQALSLKKEDKILEVGTGSGYQTAVLAEILDEIYTIEIRPHLANKAMMKLSELGYGDKVHLRIANGSLGHDDEAPFNGILVTAATFDIPKPLVAQLAEEGKMIIPIGSPEQQVLIKLTKVNGKLIEEKLLPCLFVPLIRKRFDNK